LHTNGRQNVKTGKFPFRPLKKTGKFESKRDAEGNQKKKKVVHKRRGDEKKR